MTPPKNNKAMATNTAYCLVPRRNGKLFNITTASDQNKDQKPYLTLWPTNNPNTRKAIVLGRRDLIQTTRIACGCACKEICKDCNAMESWALIRLSRQMIQISPSTREIGHLRVRGSNASLVRLDGHAVVSSNNHNDWQGQAPLKLNSILSLGSPLQQSVMEFQLVQLNLDTDTMVHVPKEAHATPCSNPGKLKKTQEKVTSGNDDVLAVWTKPPKSKQQEPLRHGKHHQELDTAKSPPLDNKKKYSLYFVPLGRNMSPLRIALLQKACKSKRNVRVVDSLQDEPTHVVVQGNVPCRALADCLNFANQDEMELFLHEKNVELCKPEWIVAHSRQAQLGEPSLTQVWDGLGFGTCSKKRKVETESTSSSHKRLERAPRDSARVKQQTSPHNNHNTDMMAPKRVFSVNLDLSDLFVKLAKLHQDCPLQAQDEWRAYMFSLIAGRLRHLNFQVSLDSIPQLAKIKGFGGSTVAKVEEFLKTGTCRRLHEFATDPMRVAMNDFMHIWGVGKKKASTLIKLGYRNIAQVRAGVASGVLTDLSENQLIGLDCFEDFREKMDRGEVEAIGKIVKEAVLERYPKANVNVMGSYRRGKLPSGDVDILITHANFYATTPRGAISELVERLRMRGHVAHHLTYLYGLEEDSQNTTDGSQDYESMEAVQAGYHSASTYMGVFYSPLLKGKRRRVDIKFYPYRERVFASLYFTGNGHFNRSMRLYSKRVKGLTLNDHGLFPVKSNVSVPRPSDKLELEPSTEKEVFDFLGLEYKTPEERDCFDAVIPMDKSTRLSQSLEEMNLAELQQDGYSHQWVE